VDTQSVSVVIPSYNRLHYLRECLTALRPQPEVLEVVVVDDCSTDGTRAYLEALGSEWPAVRRLGNDAQSGSVRSRNRGIAAARGRYIMVLDDDMVVTADFLARLLEHKRATGADVMSAPVIWLTSSDSRETALDLLVRRPAGPSINRKRCEIEGGVAGCDDLELPLLPAVMLADAETFRALQYDERLAGNAWREETDWQLRASAAGKKLVLCSHAACVHLPPAGGGQRSMRRLRYELSVLRNNAYFLRKHWRWLRESSSFDVRGHWIPATLSYSCGRTFAAVSRRLAGAQ
jgi:GT2 family glycosyltransferase